MKKFTAQKFLCIFQLNISYSMECNDHRQSHYLSVEMIYLLLNPTAALHTSAPCPRVISSGKDSSPSRGGRSFSSKCLSKVDLMLDTAGREGEWARRNQLLAHIHCFHHKHSYSQSLPSCCFSRNDLWLRGCNLSSFPLTDGCPEGSHSGPGRQ